MKELGIAKPKLHAGVIASGDQFIATAEQKKALRELVPEALCAEMEGAAAAQACRELGVAFCAVRAVSDSGDGSAHADFERFCAAYAGDAVFAILENLIKAY